MTKPCEKTIRAVVVLDLEGGTVQSAGDSVDFGDPLHNPKLRSIRARLRACLKGRAFLTTIQLKGRKLLANVRGRPVRDEAGHITGVCLEIDEVRGPEKEMTELDFVIQNMRQGLWRLDSFGIITFANPYLAQWLEVEDCNELLGKHFSKFRRLGIVSAGEVEDSLSQRYEAEFITRTGLTRRAIVVTSPTVDKKGHPNGTVDLITDITAEHAVQSKLVQEVQKMQRLASTDQLTKLGNRKAYDEALEELYRKEDDEPFGLVIIDLDHFKELNDTQGHDFGDKVLIEVARRLEDSVRDGDAVCRLGGDEFAVVLPNTSYESLVEVAARLEDTLNQRTFIGGVPVQLQVSIGAAHSNHTSTEIARAADREMYARKFARKAKSA